MPDDVTTDEDLLTIQWLFDMATQEPDDFTLVTDQRGDEDKDRVNE